MVINNSINKKTKGEIFVDAILDGTIKKNNRPNHGTDFTGGPEGFYAHLFKKYIRSCDCFLMDRRMRRGDYCG